MHTRRALTLTLAAATAVGTVAAPAAHADPRPRTPSNLAAQVDPGAVVSHLSAFERIAMASQGRRAAGERGYELSAQYVEKQLRGAGYTPRRQYFEFTYDSVVSTSLNELSPTARAVTHTPFSYSPSTPKAGVQAQLVAPSTATGCSSAEWDGVVATAKIALVSRGTCTFGEKAKAAKAAGAAAILIYNNAPGPLNGTLGGPSVDYAPATGITKADGDALLADMAKAPVQMSFVLDKIIEKRRTFNVLAETKGGSADDVLMVGAHLDGVQQGPGVNDNASGSATVLEVAKQANQLKKPAHKIRFAWWGAEELGLLGSEHYVKDLQDNDVDSLLKINGYLNFDMLASPNYIIGVYDSTQTWMPQGSARLQRAFTGYFDDRGQPYVAAPMQGGSDQLPFLEAGVPVGGLFTGAGGLKTAQEATLFGGTAGVAYDPGYHTAQDTLRNANKAALAINVKAVAHAVGTLALGEPGSAKKGKNGKNGKNGKKDLRTSATPTTTVARR